MCSFAGGQSDGLDSQRPPHGSHLHVHRYCERIGTAVMQHHMARG
jgi:hypothetical protein